MKKNDNKESINKGEIMCEFVPVNNNFKKKTIKIVLKDVKALVKYRFLYQYKALNILLYSKNRSIVLDFQQDENFQLVYEYLLKNCPRLDKKFTDIKFHTNMWVDGLMSNYDYLMYLNIMGGRSFEDLSQYPIMPWVITNYEDEDNLDLNDINNFRDLSKPIGALNQKRLESLKANYNDIVELGRDHPFLYGTYYSFPYIIFYYLIRTHPFYSLRFQGGSFGPTDRLFYSIKECWNSSYKNPGSQDVKELIPEFYNSNGEFLKNIHKLNFGKTQNEEIVDDVILPKWAKSGKDFVSIMRAALESEIVSSSLHLWIDLVFGFKQRGIKALEADNLFHYLRYDDKFYLTYDKSEEERQGEIDNIFEFGQIPVQLFFYEPHPKKRSKFTIREIICDTSETTFLVAKLKKERLNIEKKYEKERRQKENEIEEIEKKLDEKEKEYDQQIMSIDETVKKKEAEFAGYLTTLMEQNFQLKENFNNYNSNKDKVYEMWINNLKVKHNKDIESLFENQDNLYKYLKDLEKTSNKCKAREIQLIKHKEETRKLIESRQKEEKELKEQLFNLQKIIRNLSHEQQIYLKRNKLKDKEQFNLRQILKDIK